MKKKYVLLLVVTSLSFLLISCGKTTTPPANHTEETSVEGMVIKDTVENRKDIINNMIIGESKISFNNDPFVLLSDGQFTQSSLWGTFTSPEHKHLVLQMNAFDKEQEMYGEIAGYELEGEEWEENDYVQYLGVMEEAIQTSKGNKAIMYKARTGDVLFSVALFSDDKLTDADIILLKTLAQQITIEYIGDQVTSN